MDEITALAAAEAMEVLYNTEISLIAKIPYVILETLEERAIEYEDKIQVDFGLGLDEQFISREAQTILSIIHKDYWDDKTKQQVRNEFIEKVKRCNQEQPSTISSFENLNNEVVLDNETTALVVREQTKWYIKIFDKIINFFKKKGKTLNIERFEREHDLNSRL